MWKRSSIDLRAVMATPFDILGAIGFPQISLTLLFQTIIDVKASYEQDKESERTCEEVLSTFRSVANDIECKGSGCRC